MLDAVKAKGRELLVLMTAVMMLLSVISGVVFDALSILIVGAVGYFLSDPPKTDGK